ncbi:uncharacterized protein METZ01_LOCUS501362 [marine metagenome]|uniref:Uncharacterized protein n=1 Tax=marine metagenome TaxID=408172 RepID=A0A383DXE6_9ZZZZ
MQRKNPPMQSRWGFQPYRMMSRNLFGFVQRKITAPTKATPTAGAGGRIQPMLILKQFINSLKRYEV